jgi:hyperosmotically inducible protein
MKTSTLVMAGFVLTTAGLAGCDRPADERLAKSPPAAAKPAPETAPAARPSNPTAGQAIDDASITAKVKGALLAEKGVNGTDINVETAKGIVTLTGRVPDQSQVDRAAQVAREVDGVTTVQNKLTVGAS